MENKELLAQLATALAARWCGQSPAVKEVAKAATSLFEQLLTRSDRVIRERYRLGVMPILIQLARSTGNSGDVLEQIDNLARIILDQLPTEMRTLEDLIRSSKKTTGEETAKASSSPFERRGILEAEAPQLWQGLIQIPEFVLSALSLSPSFNKGRWDPRQFKRWINRIRRLIPGECADVAQAVILSTDRIFPKFGLALASASAVQLTLGSVFRSTSDVGIPVHEILAEMAVLRLEAAIGRRELLLVSEDTAYRIKKVLKSRRSLETAANELIRERNDNSLLILLEARGVINQFAKKIPFFRAKGAQGSREDIIIFSDPDDSAECSFFWAYQKTLPQVYEIKPVGSAIQGVVQVFAYMMNYNIASIFYECRKRHSCNPFMQLAPQQQTFSISLMWAL